MAQLRHVTHPVRRHRQHRQPRATGCAHDETQPWHTALVTLPAELDLLTAPQARVQLLAALSGPRTIVIVDLTGTAYCDVAAARMLLRLHAATVSDGTQLRLAVPVGPVRRVLDLLGLDRQLDLYPTVRAAVAGRAGARQARV